MESGNSRLVRVVCAGLLALTCVVIADEATDTVKIGGCTFHKHKSELTESVKKRLSRLVGQRFPATDPETLEGDQYTYNVGICSPADDTLKDQDGSRNTGPPYSEAGVIQTKKSDSDSDTSPTYVVLGSLSKADVMGGIDWISLEYDGGDHYNSHCDKADRRSVIMLLCDPHQYAGKLKVIEENNDKTSSCYYLFELEHEAICPESELNLGGLSVGSILIIIFIVVVVLYLLGGFLYMRFVVRAKGMEQIPNYAFWQDFGNLQADGCNFVCRSGVPSGSKQYRGIGDDQLQSAPEEEEDDRDDHLLPM